MPLERASFWIRFFQNAAVGVSDHDYNIPLGRNIELQGIGAGRETNGVNLFQFFFIMEDGTIKRILPRPTATANEDYVTAPDYGDYRDGHKEYPFSPYQICDVQALRVRVTNGGAGVEHFEGHFRGVYIG